MSTLITLPGKTSSLGEGVVKGAWNWNGGGVGR